MDDNNAEKISEAIFNLIPEVTRLKDLFQKWDLLDDDEKEFIDMQIEKWNSPEHKQLYKTVKQALIKWGKVQDTEGAPGCEPGYYTFSCDAQLEEELVKVLQTIESLLRRIKESSSKTDFSHLTSLVEELTAVTPFPDVPPSSPESDSDGFLLVNSPVKRRSEPIRTCVRSSSLRRSHYQCHSVKSAPSIIKDGYNTD